jgi:hypothetical protein
MTIPAASSSVRRALPLTYVLPLRRWETGPLTELTGYLSGLAPYVEVIVVDGSPPDLFAVHRAAWDDIVAHMPVDPGEQSRNGKVGGVLTGVRAAANEKVVIADDDVRYTPGGLRELAELLDGADLVRPQNYFDPLPWHARWDTARMLVNRAVGHDYPGTLGVRRSALLASGGYDGEALFENLELIRTIAAGGGRVANHRALYVRRLPPPIEHFRRQRLRQAYESLAQPARMAVELSLLPIVLGLLARRRLSPLGGAALTAIALAEAGRRRDGGTAVFPPSSSLLAPAWVCERAVCSWLALWLHLRGAGLSYAGTTFPKAATPKRVLRRRAHSRSSELRRLQ